MNNKMSMEQRLREYALWLRDPALELGSQSIFGRIRDEQSGAGGGDGARQDIIDGIPCRPDGGLGRLADRLGRELQRDRRCRDIHDLVQYLPPRHRAVMKAAYDAWEPRSIRAAAEVLGVSTAVYREEKAALLGWFEGAMFRSGAA